MKIIAIIAALLFLSACGQKGPLYLPESSSSAENVSITMQESHE